jgi:hypothetical protein
MNYLADTVLEYYWFLNFSADKELDPDTAVKRMESLVYAIETAFSAEEQGALKDAAKRSLESWLHEPDEHGYKSRSPLTPDERAFLQAIAAGRFSGSEV